MLSVLMDSHINVEFCASIKAIQYLLKYQLKGSDQATISIVAGDDREQDEVATFMSKRYVSSMEASWRIFQFPTVAVKPAIIRLPIHLENQQRILYDPTNPVQAQQALENGKRTMLSEFFQTNVEYLEARTVLFCNFPESLVYNAA